MLRVLFLLPLLCVSMRGQPANPRTEGVTVRAIITAGHFYTEASPQISREDITVSQLFQALPITGMRPLHNDIEMFVLVDNCADCEARSNFDELRRFIRSQSATTSIGVAYIDEGRLRIAQQPTRDRETVVSHLSPPSGSKIANPFAPLAELIRGWEPNGARHVVLMLTNGVDPATGKGEQNPSADAAIDAAQRAGVTIFAIYQPGADYATADFSKIYSGQIQISHVAGETGGEAYFISFGPLPSLSPFLGDVSDHLANQYEVEFLAKPPAGSGEFQDVTIQCRLREVQILAPGRVWVPGRAETNPFKKGTGK